MSLHEGNEQLRRFEVTEAGRVWPCCLVATGWDMHLIENDGYLEETTELLFEHQAFVDRMKEDPDWNNLDKHSIDEILADPIFSYHYYKTGWDKGDIPPLCAAKCSTY